MTRCQFQRQEEPQTVCNRVWEAKQSLLGDEVKEITGQGGRGTTDLLLIERNQQRGGLENVSEFHTMLFNSQWLIFMRALRHTFTDHLSRQLSFFNEITLLLWGKDVRIEHQAHKQLSHNESFESWLALHAEGSNHAYIVMHS